MVSDRKNELIQELDFSSQDAAEESMRNYIKENFADFLGDKVELLDEPDGIEKLREVYAEEIEDAGENLFKNINQLIELLNNL